MPIQPNIRMVALDLDGTVLNSQGQISPRTADAIARAARRGVVVMPATGRPLSGLPQAVAQAGGVRYALTSNGAAVWDIACGPAACVYSRYRDPGAHATAQPQLFLQRLLPADTALEVCRRLRPVAGELTVFADGRTWHSERGARWRQAYMHRSRSTEFKSQLESRFYRVPSLEGWLPTQPAGVEKLCLFTTPDALPAAFAALQGMEGIELTQGCPEDIEVTAAGVNKGWALLEAGRQLGIAREEILAIGDSDNDAAMLQAAGMAAAMANGMAHIRAMADVVSQADNDHDGVAALLEQYVL